MGGPKTFQYRSAGNASYNTNFAFNCIIIIYKLHVMSVSCESGLGKNSCVTGKQQVESALASRAKAKRDLSYIIQNVMTK